MAEKCVFFSVFDAVGILIPFEFLNQYINSLQTLLLSGNLTFNFVLVFFVLISE